MRQIFSFTVFLLWVNPLHAQTKENVSKKDTVRLHSTPAFNKLIPRYEAAPCMQEILLAIVKAEKKASAPGKPEYYYRLSSTYAKDSVRLIEISVERNYLTDSLDFSGFVNEDCICFLLSGNFEDELFRPSAGEMQLITIWKPASVDNFTPDCGYLSELFGFYEGCGPQNIYLKVSTRGKLQGFKRKQIKKGTR